MALLLLLERRPRKRVVAILSFKDGGDLTLRVFFQVILFLTKSLVSLKSDPQEVKQAINSFLKLISPTKSFSQRAHNAAKLLKMSEKIAKMAIKM